MLKDYFWMIPFFCFIGGYYLTRSFFSIAQFEAPAVIGKSLDQAVTTLSNNHLSVKLLRHEPNSDLPPATVLDQIPTPGQMVKARQTVFITVSQAPERPITPSFIGKSMTNIEQEATQYNLKIKPYYLESSYPTSSCIGQAPSPECPLTEQYCIVYIAKEFPKIIIWPDLRGHFLSEVCATLEVHGITPEISGSSQEADPPILDQRPRPGTSSTHDNLTRTICQLRL